MATHGSLTKAGKLRGQTHKVEGRKIVGTNSKLRNKSNFRKRFVLAEIGLVGKMPGQNKASSQRRRRR
jgi:small subunit ribosomal protein S30e